MSCVRHTSLPAALAAAAAVTSTTLLPFAASHTIPTSLTSIPTTST